MELNQKDNLSPVPGKAFKWLLVNVRPKIILVFDSFSLHLLFYLRSSYLFFFLL